MFTRVQHDGGTFWSETVPCDYAQQWREPTGVVITRQQVQEDPRACAGIVTTCVNVVDFWNIGETGMR
jgi:hypothetical protein